MKLEYYRIFEREDEKIKCLCNYSDCVYYKNSLCLDSRKCYFVNLHPENKLKVI